MLTDVDLTQLWFELKLELKEAKQSNIVMLMDDMERRLKGGMDYE